MRGELIGLGTTGETRFLRHVPWGLILVTALIAGIGIVNLISASRVAHAPVWINQLGWVSAGFAMLFLSLTFDYRKLHTIAWPFYFLVVVLLVIVEFRGTTVMGAQRWLVMGPVRIQPSELAKLALLLVLARFYHEEEERPEGYGLFDLWRPGLIVAVPFLLILAQPDLGTAALAAAVAGSMMIASKIQWRALFKIGLSGVLISVGAWFFVLHDYQKRRIAAFLNPEADMLGSGYHANQSMIAVGSGQWEGKGWGLGTQTQLSFLPEQHTDFVFSVFAEEWGFRGVLLLLGLYLALCLIGLRIAYNARDRHGAFLAIGTVGFLFWHVVVNIGMVTGLLPVVGVTLPLMSYGGSSALTVLAFVAVLANVGMRASRYG